MSSRGQFVGLAAQLYRVERPWGKLPTGLSYAGIADVTAMSSGRVAVLFRGDPAVLIFESDGSLADRWSMPDVVAGHYIRACASGRILLSDFDGHRIFILSEDGSSERVLGARDRPRFGAPFNHPADAVEAPDGEIFVADGYGNSCVHRFTADGTLVATWGRPGRGALEFSTPHAIAVDRAGRLLVGDRENNRVQILDRAGHWLGEIGGLFKPMAVEPTPDGGVLVTDQTPRLSLFSADGHLVGRCRTFGTVGHGLALAPDGSIFIAEMGPEMLTRLAPVPPS
jgi:sugar lactone lactonase YvrE